MAKTRRQLEAAEATLGHAMKGEEDADDDDGQEFTWQRNLRKKAEAADAPPDRATDEEGDDDGQEFTWRRNPPKSERFDVEEATRRSNEAMAKTRAGSMPPTRTR